jgi:hypothetical protein
LIAQPIRAICVGVAAQLSTKFISAIAEVREVKHTDLLDQLAKSTGMHFPFSSVPN